MEHGAAAGRAQVRDACAADMTMVAAIYPQHVLTGLASFETTPPPAAAMKARRLAVLAAGLPCLVAERVVGYAYATPCRPRLAYRHAVANSVYVACGEGRVSAPRCCLP